MLYQLKTLAFISRIRVLNSHKANTFLMNFLIRDRGITTKILQHLQISPQNNSIPANALEHKVVTELIEMQLKKPITDLFEYVSEEAFPASIGQVHSAIYKKTSQKVAIKIQYPEIKKIIHEQMSALKLLAIGNKLPQLSKWKIPIDEHLLALEKKIHEETDYRIEFNHQAYFKKKMESTYSRCPSLVEELCSDNILVQEWIDGVSLTEIKNLWPYDKKKELAKIVVGEYLKHLFVYRYIQGDTNLSNFIFSDREHIVVFWIDFGNWINLDQLRTDAIYQLIHDLSKKAPIPYQQLLINAGFDIGKLKYFEKIIPHLLEVLFEPFNTNCPYDLKTWNLEERIQGLLGENKWWFRSSGDSTFLLIMRSFMGVVQLINELNVNINWHELFLEINSDNFKRVPHSTSNSPCSNNLCIPDPKDLAENLKINIKDQNGEDLVILTLPARAILEIENFIPKDLKDLLIKREIDLEKIKRKCLDQGIVPGNIFQLKEENRYISIELI